MAPPAVLVVDDNKLVLKAITHHLSSKGLYVMTTSHPRIGSDLARGIENLIAVVLDVEMPEVDGAALSATFRSQPQYDGVPIIFYSGLTAERTSSLLTAVSGSSVVSKTDGLDALWNEIVRVTQISGRDFTTKDNIKAVKKLAKEDALNAEDEDLLDDIFDGLMNDPEERAGRATIPPQQPKLAGQNTVAPESGGTKSTSDDSVYTRATVRPDKPIKFTDDD